MEGIPAPASSEEGQNRNCPLIKDELRRQLAEHKLSWDSTHRKRPHLQNPHRQVEFTVLRRLTQHLHLSTPLQWPVYHRPSPTHVRPPSRITTSRISYARLPTGCSSFPARSCAIPTSTLPPSWNASWRPPGGPPDVLSLPPPPTFVPAQTNQSQPPPTSPPVPPTSKEPSEPAIPRPEERVRQLVLILPNQAVSQTNPDFKKATELKVQDANFSSDEYHAIHPKYLYTPISKVPTLQWKIRVAGNARVQKISCNSNLCD